MPDRVTPGRRCPRRAWDRLLLRAEHTHIHGLGKDLGRLSGEFAGREVGRSQPGQSRVSGQHVVGSARNRSEIGSSFRVDRELLARVEDLGAALRPTPVVRLAHPGLKLFAKLEYHSVVGSLKDRPAYYMLRDAIRRGAVRRTTTVIESSSGNTGAAL